MEIGEQPKLIFHGVYFVHVNFDATAEYDGKSSINLQVEPSVFYPKDSACVFNVAMDVSLKSESFFELKVSAVGDFELNKELSEQEKKGYINANAPAIMFPYVRSFISTLTSNLGKVILPLAIPTHFFKGELKEIQPSNETEQ